jgi:hypothetical protein
MSLRCREVHVYGIEHDQLCLYVGNITFAHSVFNTVSIRVLLQLFFPPVCPLPHLFSPWDF